MRGALAVLVWGSVVACARSAPPGAAEAGPEERDLLLWTVERDGAVSHMLGTCHLPLPLDAFVPADQQSILTEARVFVTEADVTAITLDTLEFILAPDGVGIRNQLEDDAWQRLSRTLRGAVPAPMLARMPPWVAGTMVVLGKMAPGAEEAAGPQLTVDVEVAGRMAEAGVEPVFLETLEEQAAMLATYDDVFLEQLQAVGVADAGPDPELQAMASICRTGDTSAFEALLAAPDYAAGYARLLADRNRAWMNRLVPEVTTGGAFVSVGAGHMIGDDGLVALLEAEGFTVQRLSAPLPPAAVGDAGSTAPEPPPEADPTIVAAWTEALQATPTAMCGAESPVRACFFTEDAACIERLTSDLALCIDQEAPWLPPFADASPEQMQAVAGCASVSVMLGGLMSGAVGEGETCAAIVASLRAGMENALPSIGSFPGRHRG